jgi:glutamate transport system ATP-binding protein
MDPKVLLFDEQPRASTPRCINEVLDVMVELAETGMTMMVVTHEMGFARRASNRVCSWTRRDRRGAKPDSFFDHPTSDRAREFLSKILTH